MDIKEWLAELSNQINNRKPRGITIYTGRGGMELLQEGEYKDRVNGILKPSDMNRQFVIYKVTHGRFKGQYRFRLLADNYELLASGEAYFNEGDIRDMAGKYFPEFNIVEGKETRKKRRNELETN